VHRAVMVIPTYIEIDNLADVVTRVRRAAPDVDILVVDDGSPDGTGALADAMAAEDDHVRVLHRTVKQGLGAAYREGFAVALAAGYDVIGEMDADGSHQPEQLPLLLGGLEHADLAIGSRWVRGGSVVNWPWHRLVLSRLGNLYTRLLLGIRVRDATAGFRVFRRQALEAIRLDEVQALGYVFQVELVHRTLRAGLRVTEVPIEFVERERGNSKMTPEVARESLVRITRWGFAQRLDQLRAILPRR